MKKTIAMIIALLCLQLWGLGGRVWADDITAEEALQQAQEFLAKRQVATGGQHRVQAKVPQLALASTVSGLYVFNVADNGGYVIVSNDDGTVPVLGFSDSGSFDPDNMPEDFDPSNIPDGTAPAEKPAESGTVTTTADGTSSATVSGSAPRREQSTTNAAEQDSTRQTRPQMGSFPSMDGAKPQKGPMVLVLLGASAAVLLAGLGFAVIFRR